jgi:hypothetical protein
MRKVRIKRRTRRIWRKKQKQLWEIVNSEGEIISGSDISSNGEYYSNNSNIERSWISTWISDWEICECSISDVEH